MEHEARNFKARHYLCGDVDVVEIKGEMTAYAEGVFNDVVFPLLREGRQRFVLDLTDMEYANSSGLGVFVKILVTIIEKYHGKLAFAGLPPGSQYANVFDINGITKFAPVFLTVSEAVSALQEMPKS